MVIKTISQLPEHTESTIQDSSLFEMSHKSGNGFISRKIKFSTLFNYILSKIKSTLGITSNTDITNVIDKTSNITKTSDGSTSLANSTWISMGYMSGTLSDSSPTDGRVITTRNYVANKISTSLNNHKIFVGTGSTVSNYIGPHDGNFQGSSFLCMNMTNGNVSNTATVGASGLLVVYGYISAPKTLDTSQCWVALEANLSSTTVPKWVMLQLQPWIVGSKSYMMQYVGFTVPIKSNTVIRISTGFNVNTSAGGYTNQGLVGDLNGESSSGANNTFWGYVIS